MIRRRLLSVGLFLGGASVSRGVVAATMPDAGFPVTERESAAGIKPSNRAFQPGNVLRYGADASGTTDSTESLNQAFISGDEVYFPPGRYRISQTISKVLTGSFRIHGAGQGTSKIVQFTDADAIAFTKTVAANVQVTVESISFEPAMLMKTGAALNVRDDNSVPSLTMRDVIIAATDTAEFKYGVRMRNCTESRFDRVTIYGLAKSNLIAWELTSTMASTVPKFFGCSVYNAFVAVSIMNSVVPGIEGVQLYGCDFTGVRTGLLYANSVEKFAYFPPQILWMGGHINSSYRNIDVTQASQISILGALFFNYAQSGTFVSLADCSDLNIANNQFVQLSGSSDGISHHTSTIANGGMIANNHFSLTSQSTAIRIVAVGVQNLVVKDNVRIGGLSTVVVEGLIDKSLVIEGNSPLDPDDLYAAIPVSGGILSLLGLRSSFVHINEPIANVSIAQLLGRRLGEVVTLKCDSSKVKLMHGAAAPESFELRGSVDFTFMPGALITLYKRNEKIWTELSRSTT